MDRVLRPASFRVFDLVSVSLFEFRFCACVLPWVEILYMPWRAPRPFIGLAVSMRQSLTNAVTPFARRTPCLSGATQNVV